LEARAQILSGKQAEQDEEKKLDAIRDPVYPGLKTGAEVESIGKPMRAGGLGEWLGRGEHPDNNVYSINYMDKKTNEYYGAESITSHAWNPLPNKDSPHSVYYNVLDHWTPTDPMSP